MAKTYIIISQRTSVRSYATVGYYVNVLKEARREKKEEGDSGEKEESTQVTTILKN